MGEGLKATITLSEPGHGDGVVVDWSLGRNKGTRELSGTKLDSLFRRFTPYATKGEMAPEEAAEAGLVLWDAVLPAAAGYDELIWRRREGERSVIEICDDQAPRAQGLPWELLFLQRSSKAEQGKEKFALREESVDVVRVMSREDAHFRTPLPHGEPLRILIVTGPQEVEGADGGADGTFDTIVDAVGAGVVSDVEVLEPLEMPRVTQLQACIRDQQSPIDLLVFRGHGTARALALHKAPPGDSPWTGAEALADALAGRVRVAVLLACRAAAAPRLPPAGDASPRGGIARTLAERGVHTVAFQTDIGSNPANLFLSTLSKSLVQGKSLPEAVEEARKAFAQHPFHGPLSFASPTLWQPSPTPLRLRARRAVQSEGVDGPQGFPTLSVETASKSDRTFAWTGAFRLASLSRSEQRSLLIAPDGRVVARQDEGRLDFAWVGRGHQAPWKIGAPLSTELPPGRVLAISRAGPEGVNFLQSTESAVGLWRAVPGAEATCIGVRPGSADLGVLRGAKALLLNFGDEVDEFPALHIEAVQAAHSGGVTAVLARGQDPNGRRVTCVSAGGAEPVEHDGPRVCLVLPLSDRLPPRVRVDDGTTTVLQPGSRLAGFRSWSHDYSRVGLDPFAHSMTRRGLS